MQCLMRAASNLKRVGQMLMRARTTVENEDVMEEVMPVLNLGESKMNLIQQKCTWLTNNSDFSCLASVNAQF